MYTVTVKLHSKTKWLIPNTVFLCNGITLVYVLFVWFFAWRGVEFWHVLSQLCHHCLPTSVALRSLCLPLTRRECSDQFGTCCWQMYTIWSISVFHKSRSLSNVCGTPRYQFAPNICPILLSNYDNSLGAKAGLQLFIHQSNKTAHIWPILVCDCTHW